VTQATAPADLLADLRPTSLGGGRYEIELDGAWSFALPSGGVLTSLALAAMTAELADADYRPISTTAIFASAVAEGAVVIQVTVLRRGKAACQLRAAVLNPAGGPGLEVTATYARPQPGPRFIGASFPAVPAPDDSPDVSAAHARWPFFRQLDVRLAAGPPIWDPTYEVGPPRLARWLRYRSPPRTAGLLDRLAVPPVVDLMPGAIMAHLGPASRLYAPSLDLTVHFVAETADEWLLVDSFARAVFDGFAACDVHLWSETGELVAYATQTMILKFVDGRPPPPGG
jgi:acyl-CoA thioesterase